MSFPSPEFSKSFSEMKELLADKRKKLEAKLYSHKYKQPKPVNQSVINIRQLTGGEDDKDYYTPSFSEDSQQPSRNKETNNDFSEKAGPRNEAQR